MKTKAQKIRLGIFFIISIVALLSILGYFTARHLLEPKNTYYVAYYDVSVSGLETGSPVKYMGINIGSISDIRINPEDFNSIIVELSIRPDVPIKEDAVADIVSIGITGLKTIEIRGGSHEADYLEEHEFIKPGVSFADDITGKAEVIALKTEQVLNNLQAFTHPENMEKITTTIENISDLAINANSLVTKADEMVEENRADIRETVLAVNEISYQLGKTSKDLENSIARVNQIMYSDTVDQVLGNLRDISLTLKEANLKNLIENFAELTEQTQRLLANIDDDIDRSSKDLAENMQLLKVTLENLSETSRQINENPSMLLRTRKEEKGPDQRLLDN